MPRSAPTHPGGEVEGRRVLVTGGSGFIGRAVVQALLDAGADVVVADEDEHLDARVHGLVGDLRDPPFARSVVTPDLDGIIHLAAVTSVLGSKEDPAGTYDANVAVTAALLERARENGVARFVMSSTNAVVGDVGRRTIHETTPLQPLTPYGATKAACEMLLSGYAASYGMAASALRFTNVYGPGMDHKDSFVPRLMRAAARDEGVEVYGDGLQVRDLVHVDDAVDAVLLAWNRRHFGPLTVGSGHSVTVNEIVETARTVTGAAIPAHHIEAKPGEMSAVVVDIRRAIELGYRPRVRLPEGLATVWDYFRSRSTVTTGVS
jgi:UDP-glucose 4-epimerase